MSHLTLWLARGTNGRRMSLNAQLARSEAAA